MNYTSVKQNKNYNFASADSHGKKRENKHIRTSASQYFPNIPKNYVGFE